MNIVLGYEPGVPVVTPAGVVVYAGGLGDTHPTGPMFTCPTGEQVYLTADCPGGTPVAGGVLTTDDQQQAEIDALFLYTHAGQNSNPAPSPSPSPSTQTQGISMGVLGAILGGIALVVFMSKR